MKKGNPEHKIALIGASLDETWAKDERIHLVTNHIVTIAPCYISIMPLKPVNLTFGINLQLNTIGKR